MPRDPFFKGLVFDENDNPVTTAHVGDEPFYVVNDADSYVISHRIRSTKLF